MPSQQPSPDRDETLAERIDRNWGELLQELRVTQTGVQILFAFPLVLPFQQRFERLGQVDRWLYVVVVGFVTVSTVLNLAPVIAHRILFAKRKKDILMSVSDTCAKFSFIALGFALVGAVALVLDMVRGRTFAVIAACCLALLILALWVVLPGMILRRARRDGTEPGY